LIEKLPAKHQEKVSLQDVIAQAANDLVGSHYAIVLTGAGISTESGLADFRGPQGIWTRDKQA
jgi:NAD-dependent deacetylase